jgi:hypothetical protein
MDDDTSWQLSPPMIVPPSRQPPATPSMRRPAVNPSDTSPAMPGDTALTTRRRATLAALLALAAVGGPAQAQMGGGGGGGGRGMRQEGGPRPDKDAKDTHAPDAAMPRDLIAAFAARLHDGLPELAITPAQHDVFGAFVASAAEVGQHNERRLQRILFHNASSISVASPLKSFIAAEVDEGEGRQEALAELKGAYDKLDRVLDERQRSVLSNLFVTVRGEVQAPRGR